LPAGTTAPGNGNFTLTITGANFAPNAVVNLTGPGNFTVHPSSTSVNARGSQIVAQFTNAIQPTPTTLVVSVTNPMATPPATSNPYYLPETQASSGIQLNQNSSSFLAGFPKGIIEADLTGNGNLSLAVVSQFSNLVSILSSDFGGPFIPGPSYPTGNQPWGIVAADFFGTGVPDLAITNSSDNSITILLANGDGTFRPGTTISLPGVFPTGLVAGDFNRDGKIDLAVVNTCGIGGACFPVAEPQGPGTVTILLSNGDGTFTVSPATLTTGNVPYSIATADFNGDGVLDLVVANSGSANVSVFMGNGDGSFVPANSLPFSGISPSAIAIGDFNSDGNLDLAVTNSGDNTVAILLNQGCTNLPLASCTFALTNAPPVAVGANPSAIATADLNADGFLDLVVTNAGTSSVTVLLGDGTGAFQAAVPQGAFDFSTGASPQGLVVGDFNQDSRLDIVTSNASGSFTFLRQAALPQIVLTTSNNFPTYGMPVFLDATLNPPPGQPAPTGTVTFFDGATSIGTADLSGYQAFIQYPGLNAGPHQITAVYNGDSNFSAATSNAVSETVVQAQSTTTLTSNINVVALGEPFVLSATILPQISGTAIGPVSFVDFFGGTKLGEATPVNNVAQLTLSTLSPGAHVIVAIFQGDANLMSSNSPTYTMNITQAATSTSISTSANPVAFGQTLTIVAAIQPNSGTGPTGLVAFMDGSAILGTANLSNNQAQFSTANLSVGPHLITAQYSGDTNFSSSTSAALTETVNQAASSTAVTSSLNPATFAQPVSFTAAVQPSISSGTITFLDGTASLGTATLVNGGAQITISTLTPGSHTIAAKYSGDANVNGSTSPALTETINQASTITTAAASVNPAGFGQSVTFTATIQPPAGVSSSGTVTFLDGTATLGTATVANNSAQLAVSGLSVGAHSITASYSGNANLIGNVSAVLTETVNPARTTTSLNSSANPSTFGQGVTLTASVFPAFGGSPAGTVTFFDAGAQLGSAPLSGDIAQLAVPGGALAAGSHSITATYSGDANFSSSASAPLADTVNPAATSTQLTITPDPASVGQSVTLTATVSSAVAGTQSGTVNFFFDGSSTPAASVALSAGVAQFSTNSLSAGTHTVSATFVSSNANFQGSSSLTLAEAVLDFAISASPSSLAVSRGHSVSYTITVSPINGFTGVVALSCSGAGINNSCTVSPSQVTVSGAAAQATVTVTVARKSTSGTRTLTFAGTSGPLSHSTTVSLTIN
jgi:hypothetical protein